MTTIRNARFDFGPDIPGERAASISTRAMEILQERLDAQAGWTGTIAALEAGPVELPAAEAGTEQAARRIAAAVYAGIAQIAERSGRG